MKCLCDVFALQNVNGVNVDDAATNCVRMGCNGNELAVTCLTDFGTYSNSRACAGPGEMICGVKTQLEAPNADNSALNGIEFRCCGGYE